MRDPNCPLLSHHLSSSLEGCLLGAGGGEKEEWVVALALAREILSPEGDCPLLSISSPFIIIRGELGAGGGGEEEWVVMKWN